MTKRINFEIEPQTVSTSYNSCTKGTYSTPPEPSRKIVDQQVPILSRFKLHQSIIFEITCEATVSNHQRFYNQEEENELQRIMNYQYPVEPWKANSNVYPLYPSKNMKRLSESEVDSQPLRKRPSLVKDQATDEIKTTARAEQQRYLHRLFEEHYTLKLHMLNEVQGSTQYATMRERSNQIEQEIVKIQQHQTF